MYEVRLKLIKLGYIVEANKLSEYSDFSLDTIDASLKVLKKKIDVKQKSDKTENTATEMTLEEKDKTLTALEAI